jgi:hypothetical protein
LDRVERARLSHAGHLARRPFVDAARAQARAVGFGDGARDLGRAAFVRGPGQLDEVRDHVVACVGARSWCATKRDRQREEPSFPGLHDAPILPADRDISDMKFDDTRSDDEQASTDGDRSRALAEAAVRTQDADDSELGAALESAIGGGG